MKHQFSIEEQIYICKNVNSKTIEEIATYIGCHKDEIKPEYRKLKANGLYDQYRKLSDIDTEALKQTLATKKRGRPKKQKEDYEKKEISNEVVTSLHGTDISITITLKEYTELIYKAGYLEGMKCGH